VNTKSNVTISLNAELTNLAKDLGLNISNTCENALKLAISRLQFGANFSVVDRAGFEPAASALRTRGQHLGIYIWRRQIFQEQI
jgi:hypothetical protein